MPLIPYDEAQRMFIVDQYNSAAGHHYYKGVRFCDRIAMVEKVGLYHNWTYIDGIELFTFNGDRLCLIQKRDYDKQFYDKDFIHDEAVSMMCNFFIGISKTINASMSKDEIKNQAAAIVDSCYKSFLDDDYNKRLTLILTKIQED